MTDAINLPGTALGSQSAPGPMLPIPPAIPPTQPQDQPQDDQPQASTNLGAAGLKQAGATLGIDPSQPAAWAKSLVSLATQSLLRTPLAKPIPGQAQPGGAQQAAPQQQPSRLQQVAGGINRVLQGVGDASTEKVNPGGGALEGFSRTLNNRNQRLSAEQTQAAMRAESMAKSIQIQRNIYKQDRDDRLSSYGQTKAMIDAMRENHDVQDNISQSQLNQMVKNNPKYFDTHTGGAVGEIPLIDANGNPTLDSKGNPVYSPLYSLAELRPKDGGAGSHTVTESESNYFKRNSGENLPAGTVLTPDQFVNIYKRSHAVQDVSDAIQKSNDGDLSAENMRQIQVELKDPGVQHYSMMVPGQPQAGLYQASQNTSDHIAAIDQQLQQQGQSPQAVQQLQQKRQQFVDEQAKIGHVIQFGFNDAAKEKYATYQLEQQKQAEAERHNRADEANKAAELKQKNQQNAISNLTGDDYLNTLPVQQQSIVRAVGEGRQALPANRKEALALLEQVHQAYPDFDETKVKTWQKANNEYRGSGKTATQVIPAYNTALEHMQDLFNNTTADGIFNPTSKAYQDREVALGYVTREVGKAVSAGVMTQSESKELLDKLSGGLTPALKRERISETAQLLHDKIDEYQNKFNDSAPSSAVKVPTLMSPKAAQSYDFITGRSQQPVNGQQPLPQAALSQLKEGIQTRFANGQTWTLQNGKAVQVQGQ